MLRRDILTGLTLVNLHIFMQAKVHVPDEKIDNIDIEIIESGKETIRKVRQIALVYNFYPRDAMLAWVIGIATCMSVRPSVCPSRAGIVSKRKS